MVANPSTDHPLRDWTADSLLALESSFDRREFLMLKHYRLIGAQSGFEWYGRIEAGDFDSRAVEFSDKHRRHCDGEFFGPFWEKQLTKTWCGLPRELVTTKARLTNGSPPDYIFCVDART